MATREAQREYQRLWMAKRRDDFFSDKSCVSCGSTEHLELDHIARATKIDHKVWSWSQARRDAEIAKCQVLCKACHREKTNEENRRPVPHGTNAGYSRGCRCSSCREGHRLHMCEYRSRARMDSTAA